MSPHEESRRKCRISSTSCGISKLNKIKPQIQLATEAARYELRLEHRIGTIDHDVSCLGKRQAQLRLQPYDITPLASRPRFLTSYILVVNARGLFAPQRAELLRVGDRALLLDGVSHNAHQEVGGERLGEHPCIRRQVAGVR